READPRPRARPVPHLPQAARGAPQGRDEARARGRVLQLPRAPFLEGDSAPRPGAGRRAVLELPPPQRRRLLRQAPRHRPLGHALRALPRPARVEGPRAVPRRGAPALRGARVRGVPHRGAEGVAMTPLAGLLAVLLLAVAPTGAQDAAKYKLKP